MWSCPVSVGRRARCRRARARSRYPCSADARAHGDGEESVTAGKTLVEAEAGRELGNGKLGQCPMMPRSWRCSATFQGLSVCLRSLCVFVCVAVCVWLPVQGVAESAD